MLLLTRSIAKRGDRSRAMSVSVGLLTMHMCSANMELGVLIGDSDVGGFFVADNLDLHSGGPLNTAFSLIRPLA
jgi:hypothetical protein